MNLYHLSIKPYFLPVVNVGRQVLFKSPLRRNCFPGNGKNKEKIRFQSGPDLGSVLLLKKAQGERKEEKAMGPGPPVADEFSASSLRPNRKPGVFQRYPRQFDWFRQNRKRQQTAGFAPLVIERRQELIRGWTAVGFHRVLSLERPLLLPEGTEGLEIIFPGILLLRKCLSAIAQQTERWKLL